MNRYRVELWIEGMDGGPDRMPDVNRIVLAKSQNRAVQAATLKASKAAYGNDRTARFLGIVVEDVNVFLEDSETRTDKALKACIKEIEQFHATAYPDCDGGCPAHEALALAKAALDDPEWIGPKVKDSLDVRCQCAEGCDACLGPGQPIYCERKAEREVAVLRVPTILETKLGTKETRTVSKLCAPCADLLERRTK